MSGNARAILFAAKSVSNKLRRRSFVERGCIRKYAKDYNQTAQFNLNRMVVGLKAAILNELGIRVKNLQLENMVGLD